ncbi:MAG: amidohydrolase family protein [Candidatus Eremiobacteraeota bacterium]|nr:amidohydrolase family protein [Candidatus Eremiobacteraeota bacterium]
MTTLTRRSMLAGAAGVGAGLTLRSPSSIAQTPRLVDVHTHFGPPNWLAALAAKKILAPPTTSLAEWPPERMLESMDRAGTRLAMLSLTAPGAWFLDGSDARRLARDANEYAARIVAEHPGRFGFWAALPLGDIDASLAEIAYSLDTLKADGIELFTSTRVEGKTVWLGDPAFDPIFAELDRRGAVTFVHHTIPSCCFGLMPQNAEADRMLELFTDNTRAISQMIFSGASQRFSRARVIWSGVGTMPSMSGLYESLAKDPRYAQLLPSGFLFEARKFYYDTAGTFNTTTLRALHDLVPPGRIVLGTDLPFRRLEDLIVPLRHTFSQPELSMIGSTNIRNLLPRVAAMATPR